MQIFIIHINSIKMPTKKVYRKRQNYKKKGYNISRSKRNSYYKGYDDTVKIYRNVIPDMLMVKLTYLDMRNIGLNVGNGHRYTRQWRANGPIDPQVALGGHSPIGYDQYSDLFRTYTVLQSSCHVTCTLDNGDDTGNANIIQVLAVNRSNQSAPYLGGTLERVMELPQSRWKVVGPPASAKAQSSLFMKYYAKQFWKRKTLTDSNQESETNTVPVNQSYFDYIIENRTGGLFEVDNVQVNTKISYLIAFRHPRILEQSGFLSSFRDKFEEDNGIDKDCYERGSGEVTIGGVKVADINALGEIVSI